MTVLGPEIRAGIVTFGSIFGIPAGIILMEATPEYVGTVCSKSGTYQIRAPTPEGFTKEEQLHLCQHYVESYEKVLTKSSWYRPKLQKLCWINPDDILKNIGDSN